MKMKSVLAVAGLMAAAPVFAQAPAAGHAPAGAASAQAPRATAPPPASSSGAPAVAVDPAKAAAVKELLAVTDSGKLGEELVDLVTTQVRQVVSTAIPQSDRLQQFMDAFSKNLTTRVTATQINDAVIPVYAQHLSLQDIQALVAFYKSPAGQDVMKALPQIVQESQETGRTMARTGAIDTMRQMSGDYPEINPILARQNGAPAPGASPAQPAQSAPPPSSQPSLRQIPSQQ